MTTGNPEEQFFTVTSQMITEKEFYAGHALSGILASAQPSDARDPGKIVRTAFEMASYMVKEAAKERKNNEQ